MLDVLSSIRSGTANVPEVKAEAKGAESSVSGGESFSIELDRAESVQAFVGHRNPVNPGNAGDTGGAGGEESPGESGGEERRNAADPESVDGSAVAGAVVAPVVQAQQMMRQSSVRVEAQGSVQKESGEKAGSASLNALRPESSEKGERLQVTGTSTASVFAGPEPWNRAWVFEGMESRGALVPEKASAEKPQAEGSDQKTALPAEVRAAMPELQAASAGVPGGPSKDAVSLQLAAVNVATQQAPASRVSGSTKVETARAPKPGVGAPITGTTAGEAGPSDGIVKTAMQSATSPVLAVGELTGQMAALDGKIESVRWTGEQRQNPYSAAAGAPDAKAPVAPKAAASGRMAGVMGGDEFLRAKGGMRLEAREGLTAQGAGDSGERIGRELPRMTVAENSGSFEGQFAAAASLRSGVESSAQQGPGASMQRPVEVAGDVIPGAMTRERLSSAALTNVSTGIHGLTNAGGGEMRIHLRPEALGEVHVHVMTKGGQVALNVRASSEEARRVIEESMSHLRESLAGQSLQLGRVEVSVAQPTSQAGMAFNDGAGQGGQQGQSGNDSFSGLLDGRSGGREQGHSNGQDSSGSRNDREAGIGSRPLRMNHPAAARSAGAGSSGRLDVRA